MVACGALFGLRHLRQLNQALHGKLEPADGFQREALASVSAPVPLREDGRANHERIVDTANGAFEPGNIAQIQPAYGAEGRADIHFEVERPHERGIDELFQCAAFARVRLSSVT